MVQLYIIITKFTPSTEGQEGMTLLVLREHVVFAFHVLIFFARLAFVFTAFLLSFLPPQFIFRRLRYNEQLQSAPDTL